jgi:acrylyl-CoA reductase (NADPH)
MDETTKFKALLVTESQSGEFSQNISEQSIDDLPAGELLIKNHYSSINYKDALSASGHKGVTREYPHIPGIDAAGEVVASNDKRFKQGDKVIVTGYDLGMNHWGGFAQYIKVPNNWAVKCPENLGLKEAMLFGTAGFTAMLAIYKMQQLLAVKNPRILVTGASGGVGSILMAILSEEYAQISVTTRSQSKNEAYLQKLGADNIIYQEEFQEMKNDKALYPRRWDVIIDNLGGRQLSGLVKSIDYHGLFISCGNILGSEFNMNLFPYILRGVSMIGITSANAQMQMREIIWKKIANSQKILKKTTYDEIVLAQTPNIINSILSGTHHGRTIINLLKS